MRGAPARAIQELAGHKDLITTQRYMHLSPAALDGAIRLLESSGVHRNRGDILETADRDSAISNEECHLIGGVDGTRTRGLRRDRPAF